MVVRSVSGLALGEFPASGKYVPRLSRRLKPWGVGRGPHLWEVAGPSSRRGYPYLLVALRAHSQAADVLLSSVFCRLWSGTTFNVLEVSIASVVDISMHTCETAGEGFKRAYLGVGGQGRTYWQSLSTSCQGTPRLIQWAPDSLITSTLYYSLWARVCIRAPLPGLLAECDTLRKQRTRILVQCQNQPRLS